MLEGGYCLCDFTRDNLLTGGFSNMVCLVEVLLFFLYIVDTTRIYMTVQE